MEQEIGSLLLVDEATSISPQGLVASVPSLLITFTEDYLRLLIDEQNVAMQILTSFECLSCKSFHTSMTYSWNTMMDEISSKIKLMSHE